MQKILNLKLIYGCIYGVLSLIVGGLFLFILFANKLGQLWLSILFVNGVNGSFSFGWFIVCLFCYIAFFILSCRLGVRRGDAISNNSEGQKKTPFFLYGFSCLVFIVFAVLIVSVVIAQVKAYRGLSTSIVKIDTLQLNQKDDKLITTVRLKGKSSDRYELQIAYKANSFVVAELESDRQIIPLKHNIQIVDLEMDFSHLSTLYRDALEEYVPVFNRDYDFEEFVDVVATLRLDKHHQYERATIVRLGLEKSEESATARFRFRCNQEGCEVVQDGKKAIEALVEE